MRQATINYIAAAVVSLGIGVIIGIAVTNPPVQTEYITDNRFTDLEEIDQKIFSEYAKGIGEASGMLLCIELDDYDCLDERTNEVDRITTRIKVLFSQRRELIK